jgi:hypothetical protein
LQLNGYADHPQGLTADLLFLLPLRLTPEILRAFGHFFPGPVLLRPPA